MNEKTTKLLVTGSAVAIVNALGMPITGSVAASLLTQSACDVVLPELQKRFFAANKGIANHDIQRALIAALKAALKDVAQSYSHPSAATKRLFGEWQASLQNETLLETILEENVLTYFQKDAHKTPKFWESFNLRAYLDQEDFHLKAHIKKNLSERVQYYFKQELKTNEEARVAIELLIFETLLIMGQTNVQLNQKLTEDLDFFGNLWVSAIRKFNDKLDEILENQKKQATFEQVKKLNEKIDDLKGVVLTKQYLTMPPPKTHKNFVGRADDLRIIHNKIQEHTQIVLVNGMGGVGKSTVAQRYCELHQADYQHICWFSVIDNIPNAVRNSLLPETLALPPRLDQTADQHFALLWNKLANIRGNNLMVIDNANNAAELEQQPFDLPHWKLLITSRTQIDRFAVHNVDVLPLPQARDLFVAYYPKAATQTSLLDKLLQAIGRHTLSIELLAKNLKAAKRYSLQNLCDDLANKGILQLSKAKKVRTDYQPEKQTPKTVILGMFDIQPLSELEQGLLLQLAVLPSVEISYDFLLEMLNPENAEHLEEVGDGLVEKGWLTYHEDTESYKLHPIIQEVIREKITPTYEKCRELIRFFFDSIAKKFKINPNYAIPCEPYARSLILNIQDEHLDIATLSNNLASVYSILGKPKEALEFSTKALNIQEKILPPSHPILGRAYSNHAGCHLNLRDFDNAIFFYEKAIKILKIWQLYPNLVASYSGCASAFQEMSRSNKALINKALEYQIMAIDIAKKTYPINTKVMSILYNDLATICRSMKLFVQALKIQQKSVEILHLLVEQNKLDKNHGAIGIAYNVLHQIYLDLNRPEEAKKWLDKSILIFKTFPDNHPHLINALNGQKRINEMLNLV